MSGYKNNIMKLPNGRYRVRINWRKQSKHGASSLIKMKTFARKMDADNWLLRQKTRRNDPHANPDDTVLLKVVMEGWLNNIAQLVARGVRSGNYLVRCRTSWKNLQWLLEKCGTQVCALTPDWVRKYEQHRQGLGRHAYTIRNEVSALRAGLRWACNKSNQIGANPLQNFDTEQIERVPKYEVPTPEQLQRVFDKLTDLDTRKAVWALLKLGCRVGALLELTAERLKGGYVEFREGVKGRWGYIRPWPEFPYRLPTHGLLFTKAGKAWRQCTILERLQRACEDAGEQKISIHALRHTFVTYTLARGVPLSTTMMMTGHRNLSTLEWYNNRAKMYQDYLDDRREDGYMPRWNDRNGRVE